MLPQTKNYQVKIADEDAEYDLIHKLNYKIFVEEIPQHERNDNGSLMDRFHLENTYLIALDGEHLAGMIAVRGNRPFSLDLKISDLNSYLPAGRKVCEIRLLAIEKEYRGGKIFFLLMKQLVEYSMKMGYDYAVISGTTRQQKLYQHLGFQPFHPRVGKKGAYYIPMCAALEDFQRNIQRDITRKG